MRRILAAPFRPVVTTGNDASLGSSAGHRPVSAPATRTDASASSLVGAAAAGYRPRGYDARRPRDVATDATEHRADRPLADAAASSLGPRGTRDSPASKPSSAPPPPPPPPPPRRRPWRYPLPSRRQHAPRRVRVRVEVPALAAQPDPQPRRDAHALARRKRGEERWNGRHAPRVVRGSGTTWFSRAAFTRGDDVDDGGGAWRDDRHRRRHRPRLVVARRRAHHLASEARPRRARAAG